MPPRVFAIAVGLTIAAATPLLAQSNDALPRDVVAAILRNVSGPSDPQILVSQIPTDLATRLSFPPGAHVIASLLGSAIQIIGSAPGTADSVRHWFETDFERRGYEAESIFGMAAAPAFRPAERSPSNGGYCGDAHEYHVTAQQRSPKVVEFVVRANLTGLCNGHPSDYGLSGTRWSGSGTNPPDFPLLVHPRDAEVSPGCSASQSGSPSRETSVTISATSPATQLLTHYGRQLDSAGWKVERTLVGAAGTWTRKDSTGRDVRLTVTVIPGLGPLDCRKIIMNVTEIHR